MTSELRWCGYCKSWRSKPCGDGCAWLPTDPTLEDLRAMDAAKCVPVPLQALLDLREYLLTEFQMEHYKAKFAALEAALEAVGKGTE